MSAEAYDFLSDSTEDTSTRFVCFIGESMRRFDLAITTTNRFYGKKLVTDLQSGTTAIIGSDDLEEEGYLEHVYRLNEEEAAELREFLTLVVGNRSIYRRLTGSAHAAHKTPSLRHPI